MSKYLIVSCETTGISFNDTRNPTVASDTQRFAIVSVGAIVTDTNFNNIEELYVEINYEDYSKIKWSDDISKIHTISQDYLSNSGLSLTHLDAVSEIGTFIVDHFGDHEIPVIGHNTSSFVLPFFDELFTSVDVYLPFSSHVLDLSTLGVTLLGTGTKKDIFNIMGCNTKTRNALLDARNILKCFRQCNKIWNTIYN